MKLELKEETKPKESIMRGIGIKTRKMGKTKWK